MLHELNAIDSDHNLMYFDIILVFIVMIIVASEVSRLKLIVDDLKASHEEKDNAISRIQNEIERLREVRLCQKISISCSHCVFMLMI